jgi:hypothetical protein
MPNYKATLARNIRQYQTCEFSAPDDEAAKAFILTAAEAERDLSRDEPPVKWGPPHEFTNIDGDDPSIMLDRWQSPPPYDDERLRSLDGIWETVEDGISVPGHLYYARAKAFIEQIADLHRNHSGNIPHPFKSKIEEARQLLGLPAAPTATPDLKQQLKALHKAGLSFADCTAYFASLDNTPRSEALRDAARLQHHRGGEVEIDATPIISDGADPSGAYVLAWVWAALPPSDQQQL